MRGAGQGCSGAARRGAQAKDALCAVGVASGKLEREASIRRDTWREAQAFHQLESTMAWPRPRPARPCTGGGRRRGWQRLCGDLSDCCSLQLTRYQCISAAPGRAAAAGMTSRASLGAASLLVLALALLAAHWLAEIRHLATSSAGDPTKCECRRLAPSAAVAAVPLHTFPPLTPLFPIPCDQTMWP